jgi:organic hydroperoxide reductase OsmC/OhrA
LVGITISWIGPDTDDLKLQFSHKALPTELIIKKSQLPREQQVGCARELLLAAIAECIAEWILLSLRHATIPLQQFIVQAHLKQEMTTHTLEGIILTLQVAVAERYRLRAEKIIQSILRRGCLMTRSIAEGIPVSYTLQFQFGTYFSI